MQEPLAIDDAFLTDENFKAWFSPFDKYEANGFLKFLAPDDAMERPYRFMWSDEFVVSISERSIPSWSGPLDKLIHTLEALFEEGVVRPELRKKRKREDEEDEEGGERYKVGRLMSDDDDEKERSTVPCTPEEEDFPLTQHP